MERSGFGLIEIFVTVVIIALLAVAIFRVEFPSVAPPGGATVEQGEAGLQQAKQLQQELDKQSAGQQSQVNGLSQ